MRLLFAAALCLIQLAAPARADEQDQDRHVGYYYPQPAYKEVYPARSVTLPEMTKGKRIDFVVGLTRKATERPFVPPYSIFAKGEHAEKLIIVANQDGTLDTLYRAKALLATMTAVARGLPIFREHHVEEILTFLDLLKLMGFERVTVSDGDSFAHQIDIE